MSPNQQSTLIVEIARLRPQEGAEARLLEIRDAMVESYAEKAPAFVSAQLVIPRDGETWVDLWYWTSKEGAHESFKLIDEMPLFKEWDSLTEMVQLEWADVVSDVHLSREA